MSKTLLQLFSEFSKTLKRHGAPLHICTVVDSIGDTIDEVEALEILRAYNDGMPPYTINKTSLN